MQRKNSGSTAQEEGASFLKKNLPREENPHFVIILRLFLSTRNSQSFQLNKIKTINDKFWDRLKLCACGMQQGYKKSVISPEKETLGAVFPPFPQKSLLFCV